MASKNVERDSEIVKLYRSGIKTSRIASRFSISPSRVYWIVDRAKRRSSLLPNPFDGLSVRAHNILRWQGITRIDQLEQFDIEKADHIKNCGLVTIAEIRTLKSRLCSDSYSGA